MLECFWPVESASVVVLELAGRDGRGNSVSAWVDASCIISPVECLYDICGSNALFGSCVGS